MGVGEALHHRVIDVNTISTKTRLSRSSTQLTWLSSSESTSDGELSSLDSLSFSVVDKRSSHVVRSPVMLRVRRYMETIDRLKFS